MGFLRKVQTLMLGAQYDDDEYVEDEYIEEMPEEPSFYKASQRERTELLANTRSKKPARESNILTMPGAVGAGVSYDNSNVVICKPRTIDDASVICKQFKDNSVCIVSLEGLEHSEAQRIADVLSGAVFVLDGIIERITNCVFVMAPSGYNVSNELKEQIKSGASFLPWLLSTTK